MVRPVAVVQDLVPVGVAQEVVRVETVVVLSPTESIMYPRGAVLLYTEAWIR